MANFFTKLQIFLDSRKVFKNWYSYPKVYFKLLKDEYVIFETKNNLKIKIRVNSTDLMALTNVWMINEYEIEKFKIKKDDIMIDVGAHIGLFSLLASKSCFAGKIFSYEPINENFEMLMQNIKSNKLKNIFPFNLAVSKNTSNVKLFLDKDESAHSIFQKNTSYVTVESISLQKIFDDNDINFCKILKLDCEGAEYEIIDSLPDKYFEKIQNMIIEYHLADSKPELGKDLISKIKNAGFQITTRPHHNDMGLLIATK
jgi:FkbM family methyltransferase|tara:strand:- start:601 stop:1371 length:771 start_codon:yes stop_codon:yes gene_type:complete